MPKPTGDEGRGEFVSRCMADGLMAEDFPDADQRLAVCGDIYDRSRERAMTLNDQLLKAVRARGSKRTQFQRGILTADSYVKTLQDCLSPELCHKYMASGLVSFDDVLRKAASTLVYSNDEMDVEEIYGQKTKLPARIELPKDTLMVFRHVLTTSLKDRDGDVLRTEGAEVDPKMLLLWQHVHTMPIGKMLDTAKRTKSRLELYSAIVDMNEVSHDAAVMVDNQMGRFSHGFRAIDYEELKPGKGEEEVIGFEIKEFEIMEESLVSVPANTDAETTDILLSLVDGGKLTSQMMKECGKAIRERMPPAVPGVSIEYKETVDGTNRQLTCGTFGDLKAAHDAGLIGAKTDENEQRGGGEAGKDRDGALPSEQKDGEGEAEKKDAPDEKVSKGFAGVTSEVEGHSHTVKLDEEGNGKTSTEEEHSHKVEGFKVLEEDDHVHGLDKGKLEETSTISTFRDGELVGEEFHCTIRKAYEKWQKAGRSLSKANEERLKEAKSIVDEVIEMSDVARPAKAMLREAAAALDAILSGLGGEDGEAEALTFEKALAYVLANADGKQRDKVMNSIRAIEKSKGKQKRLARYRSLKR
jgi:hypothetical protein